MTLECLIPKTLNYSDLVNDILKIKKYLGQLQYYLNDESSEFPRSQRINHVKYVTSQMINIGEIEADSPEYGYINLFYQNNFKESAPYFVIRHVLHQRS